MILERVSIEFRNLGTFSSPQRLAFKRKTFGFWGKAPSAALVDFGLFLFHNAEKLLAQGVGPYFYFQKWKSFRGSPLE